MESRRAVRVQGRPFCPRWFRGEYFPWIGASSNDILLTTWVTPVTERLKSVECGTLQSRGHFPSSKREDILVDAEQIVRVILQLQFHKPVIVAAISHLDTPLLFLGHEVHVHA